VKITKEHLRNIILEETQKAINEGLLGGAKDYHARYYGPDETWVDAVKLALSDRDLMSMPVRPGQTMIPIDEDPIEIVAGLPPNVLVGIIMNLFHEGQLNLAGDDDIYRLMDDLHAVGHGGEPRFQGAYKLRELFGGLNPRLDKKLP